MKGRSFGPVACSGLLAACLAAAAVGSAREAEAQDPLRHKVTVSLFQYAGADEGEAKNHFSRFKGILRDKMTILVEELTAGTTRFDYLNLLSLAPPGNGALPDNLTNEAAARNYWTQSRSLLLLRGSIVPETGGTYFAQSRLYFGGLSGTLPAPSLSIRLPIDGEQFSNTNDAHSLALYYALAMDAARLEEPPASVLALLSKAEDKIRDLTRRHALTPEVLELQKAVERAVAAEKRRGPPR